MHSKCYLMTSCFWVFPAVHETEGIILLVVNSHLERVSAFYINIGGSKLLKYPVMTESALFCIHVSWSLICSPMILPHQKRGDAIKVHAIVNVPLSLPFEWTKAYLPTHK